MKPEVTAFFHRPTYSVAYVVAEPDGDGPGNRRCAIVDSVLDFDPNAGRTGTGFADKIAAFVRDRGLEVVWHLETHAHADHFSAASYLKDELGGRVAIGANVTKVQELWKGIYNFGPEFRTDGSQFDHLFRDGDRFTIGRLEGYVFDAPGLHDVDGRDTGPVGGECDEAPIGREVGIGLDGGRAGEPCGPASLS